MLQRHKPEHCNEARFACATRCGSLSRPPSVPPDCPHLEARQDHGSAHPQRHHAPSPSRGNGHADSVRQQGEGVVQVMEEHLIETMFATQHECHHLAEHWITAGGILGQELVPPMGMLLMKNVLEPLVRCRFCTKLAEDEGQQYGHLKEAASSMLPYCWPSSSRARSTPCWRTSFWCLIDRLFRAPTSPVCCRGASGAPTPTPSKVNKTDRPSNE